MEIPAGWYPDPAGDTTKIRYWDGQAWTEQTQPALNPELQPGVGGFAPAPQPGAPLQPIYASGQGTPPYAMAPVGTDRKGFATASLVLGIVGILCCCFSWVATIPGILAIIFGALGTKSSKKGMAIAGIICGAVAIILGIFMLIFLVSIIEDPTSFGLPADTFEGIEF